VPEFQESSKSTRTTPRTHSGSVTQEVTSLQSSWWSLCFLSSSTTRHLGRILCN